MTPPTVPASLQEARMGQRGCDRSHRLEALVRSPTAALLRSLFCASTPWKKPRICPELSAGGSKSQECERQRDDGEHHRQYRGRHQEEAIELFGSEFPQHEALVCSRRGCSRRPQTDNGCGVLSVKQITLHACGGAHDGEPCICAKRHFEASCPAASAVIFQHSPARTIRRARVTARERPVDRGFGGMACGAGPALR